jgi:hypothetical protein
MASPAHSQEDAFDAPAAAPRRRFFFDVHDGEVFTVDEDGVELEDEYAAQQEAVRVLPAIAKDALPDGTEREFTVEVRDESDRKLLRATLSLKVEVLG